MARHVRVPGQGLLGEARARKLALVPVLAAALFTVGCANSSGSATSSQTAGRWATGVERAPPVNFAPSEYQVAASPRVSGAGPITRRGGGYYKLGKPYKIAERWYVPREEPDYDRVGKGSWYGDSFHGRLTANGETFDKYALTGAHPTLPLPSYVYVTNRANGRTVLVRINDRGPYANGRIIDLSHRVATVLGFERVGIADVRVRYAGRAPLDGNRRREEQFLASQPWHRGGSPLASLSNPVMGLGGPR
ncbi:MAG: septal ring lytic transglycosylase RlpA family protein [Hyphomicrobiaceae bacterium]